MWFNEDEEEEGEAVVPPVEKSKPEDDFPDSYEKFMETKKGISSHCHHIYSVQDTQSVVCSHLGFESQAGGKVFHSEG